MTVKDLAINGYEVLNIPPSKQVGEVLNRLLDIIIDFPELNDKKSLLYLLTNEN